MSFICKLLLLQNSLQTTTEKCNKRVHEHLCDVSGCTFRCEWFLPTCSTSTSSAKSTTLKVVKTNSTTCIHHHMKNSLGCSVNPNWTLCAHTKLQIQFLQLQKSSLCCWILDQFHVTYTSSLTQHEPRENGEGIGRDCEKREALSQDA